MCWAMTESGYAHPTPATARPLRREVSPAASITFAFLLQFSPVCRWWWSCRSRLPPGSRRACSAPALSVAARPDAAMRSSSLQRLCGASASAVAGDFLGQGSGRWSTWLPRPRRRSAGVSISSSKSSSMTFLPRNRLAIPRQWRHWSSTGPCLRRAKPAWPVRPALPLALARPRRLWQPAGGATTSGAGRSGIAGGAWFQVRHQRYRLFDHGSTGADRRRLGTGDIQPLHRRRGNGCGAGATGGETSGSGSAAGDGCTATGAGASAAGRRGSASAGAGAPLQQQGLDRNGCRLLDSGASLAGTPASTGCCGFAKPAEQAFHQPRPALSCRRSKHGRRLSQGSDAPATADRNSLYAEQTILKPAGSCAMFCLSVLWARTATGMVARQPDILAPPGPSTLNPAGRRTG